MEAPYLLTAMIFLKPITYDSARLWMLLPLTLAIAVVYKTSRLKNLRTLPLAGLLLWGSIVGGMIGVALGLYIIMFLFL